jgi:hypothetical protein
MIKDESETYDKAEKAEITLFNPMSESQIAELLNRVNMNHSFVTMGSQDLDLILKMKMTI